jgi:hypothetical protein
MLFGKATSLTDGRQQPDSGFLSLENSKLGWEQIAKRYSALAFQERGRQ